MFSVDGTPLNVVTTLDGGSGVDTFNVGQLYQHSGTSTPNTFHAAGMSVQSSWTTEGWLTDGNSGPLACFGGSENDVFNILSNKAPLELHGGAGADRFVMQTFAPKSTLTTQLTLGALLPP